MLSELCFNRKPRRRKSLETPGSVSAGNSPIRGLSRNSNYTPRTSYRTVSISGDRSENADEDDFICPLCKKPFLVPRLLACLHSFCTQCLQEITLHLSNDGNNDGTFWAPSPHPEPNSSRSPSARSGYENGARAVSVASKVSWSSTEQLFNGRNSKNGIYVRKMSGKCVHFLICPTCGDETPLPIGGISALPINHLLQQKMVTFNLGREDTKLLCDLCITDIPAENRCLVCSVNACTQCGKRSHKAPGHVLVPLPARRPRSCDVHPALKLNLYCETCCQLICKNCCLLSHEGHSVQAASAAAEQRATALRTGTARASFIPENVQKSLSILEHHAKELDLTAQSVEEEVRVFSWQYTRAVAEHTRALEAAAAAVRYRYQDKVAECAAELNRRAEASRYAVMFAQELLEEASDEELLLLCNGVAKRLDWCSQLPEPRPETSRVALIKDAVPDVTTGLVLAGRIVTANVDVDKCRLDIKALQKMRVHRRQEVQLQLVDTEGEPMCFGGERVVSYFRYKQSIARPTPADVRDNKDGTYTIVVTPDQPGAIQLAVLVNDKAIKGSPFAGSAVLLKPHSGKFHCCTYCSTGGNKEAICGCGSSMGAGYKGCGHGHVGHPGARHWSCCGSTESNSECIKAN